MRKMMVRKNKKTQKQKQKKVTVVEKGYKTLTWLTKELVISKLGVFEGVKHTINDKVKISKDKKQERHDEKLLNKNETFEK